MTEQEVRRRSPKFTGARELMLIEELATGDRTHAELAELFGCEEHTITNAQLRLKDRIAEAARGQVSHLGHLWITRKDMRMAQYEAEAERNIALINEMELTAKEFAESAGLPGMGPDPDKLARLQSNLFKALAAAREESGESSGKTLVHIIRGVD